MYIQSKALPDEVNSAELQNLEKREDGKFEILDVKLDNRKTKNLDAKNLNLEDKKQVQKLDVVTEKNFEEFKKRFADENGELVGYVLSGRDYESLALNMADIRRYIEQQKEIIIYYEKAITPKER